MNIKNSNTCLNCENLLRDFVCQKHNQKVDISNYCESHSFKVSITKDSSCSNCSNYNNEGCSNPDEASASMVCFDWEK